MYPPLVHEMGPVASGELINFIVGFAIGDEHGESQVQWKDGEWGVVWVSAYQQPLRSCPRISAGRCEGQEEGEAYHAYSMQRH